jgi:hypothetical protein
LKILSLFESWRTTQAVSVDRSRSLERNGERNVAYSERARRLVAERARVRNEQRAAAEKAAQDERDAYFANHLDRRRAAEFLGMSEHRLKRLQSAGTGPACLKSGPHKQSPVVWKLSELREWRDDPRAYLARRAQNPPQ